MMAEKFAWTRVCMEDFWKNMVQVLDCFQVRSDVSEIDGTITEYYVALLRDEWTDVREVPVFCLIHNLHPNEYQATWEYYVQEHSLTVLAAIAAVKSLAVC